MAEEACRPRFFYPVSRERARENVCSRERNVLALRPSGPSRPPGHGGGFVLWVVLIGPVKLDVQIEVARNYRGTSLKRKGFDKKQAFLRQDFLLALGKFLKWRSRSQVAYPPRKCSFQIFGRKKQSTYPLKSWIPVWCIVENSPTNPVQFQNRAPPLKWCLEGVPRS